MLKIFLFCNFLLLLTLSADQNYQGHAQWIASYQNGHEEQAESAVGKNGYYNEKRSVSSLAKNNIFPKPYSPAPKRSIPPILSAYKGVVTQGKRYLGALAKNGDLKYGRPQQKKYAAGGYPNVMIVEDLEPKRGEEAISPAVMKLELINSLKPVLLQYIDEMGVDYEYDPRKVDLFLENLANAMFDRNEEYTLDHIKSLAQTGYFGKELDNSDRVSNSEDQKRNIQSLAREFNVSFAGLQPTTNQYEPKRNLQSIVRNSGNNGPVYSRYSKACYYPEDCVQENKEISDERDPQFWADIYRYFGAMPANTDKRHTMFDIDEPAMNVEYSTPLLQSAVDPADYNDYPEQDGAIPVGKRYLGALARNGWLPKGFVARSGKTDYEKRHIGSLARLGWLPNPNAKDTNRYYRGGRDFGLPGIPPPKSYFLKAVPQLGHCQCKRGPIISRWTPWINPNFIGQYTPPYTINPYYPWTPQTIIRHQGKRYLLVPPVNNFIPRKSYSHWFNA